MTDLFIIKIELSKVLHASSRPITENILMYCCFLLLSEFDSANSWLSGQQALDRSYMYTWKYYKFCTILHVYDSQHVWIFWKIQNNLYTFIHHTVIIWILVLWYYFCKIILFFCTIKLCDSLIVLFCMYSFRPSFHRFGITWKCNSTHKYTLNATF